MADALMDGVWSIIRFLEGWVTINGNHVLIDDFQRDIRPLEKQMGTNRPKNIKIAQAALREIGLESTTERPGYKGKSPDIAMFNNSTGVVWLNKNAQYWKDPVGIARKAFESGFLASPSPLQVVFHEAGHQFDVSDNWHSPGHRELASHVSKYAQRNPGEFVSEVFAGIHTGQSYGEDVMRIYHLYKGKIKNVITNSRPSKRF